MRDLIRSFAATAIIQLANIASGVMLARMLLPEGRGELAAAMLWPPVVATLGAFGISEATAFLVARRAGPQGQILASALVFASVLSAVTLPIGWIVLDVAFADAGATLRAAAFLYLAYIPLSHFGMAVMAVHQGSLSIGRWNVLRASSHVTFALLIPLLHALGWGTVFGFALASLAAGAVVIVLGLAAESAPRPTAPRVETLRALANVGARAHLSNAVAVLGDRLDQLFISVLLAPADLGLYVVAATIARGLGGLGDTLATLVLPKTAHLESPAHRAEIVGRYTRGALLVSAPPVIGGIVLAKWLIVWIFGEAYASVAPVMQLLLLTVVPFNVKCVMTAALKGANEGVAAGGVQLAGLAVSMAALGALLPLLGLAGAAIAALVAQIAGVAMMAYQLRRRLGVRFTDQLWPRSDDIAFLFTTARLRPQNR